MDIEHVVWDWNGTLLDDVACCVEVANQLLSEFELPQLEDLADYHSKFRFPIIEYYADLGFDTSPSGNFAEAARRFIELYGEASAACELHDGATDALSSLQASGVRQVVISASAQENLNAQLAPFQLDRWLASAHGIGDIYAASKEGVARNWLQSEDVDPRRVLFVGDSEHDHAIAESLGSHCVLFSGGHHAHDHLLSLGAPVVRSLSDVPEFVRSVIT